MEGEAQYLTLPILGVTLTLVGMAVGGTVLVRRWISESAGKAHARIDRLDDEVKEVRREYVRRDDLSGHMSSFEKKMDAVGANLDRISVRFDSLQQALIQRPNERTMP